MNSPIEAAERLVEEIRASKTQKERAAFAILHQGEAEACIENLIGFIRGYIAGSSADQERLTNAASALLTEIAKLRDARLVRGGRTMADDFIDGTAPRLWELADKLRHLIEC